MKHIWQRRLRRGRIGVPKGMLRHITLDILRREPTSGAELMEEIEYYTDWRPSPGSVYPLLSKFEQQGLIELVESDDPTLKRYGLTESGIQLLEEYREFEPDIRSRYHSIQKIFWKLFEGMNEALFEAYSRFVKAIEEIHFLIKDNPEASSMIQELLLDASKKIEKIHEDLKKQK